MYISELFEDLNDFRKSLHDRVRANILASQALAKHHNWKFSVGDVFLSTKTGKTYTITDRQFQKRIRRDESFKPMGPAELSATYFYKTNDGGSGTFWEDLLASSTTMKKLAGG